MQISQQGFTYQTEDGQYVGVPGGVVVNDDDPILDVHGGHFVPYEAHYLWPKRPVKKAVKPSARN